ncbi:sensor histidine kinase [Amycolatopsis nigrescens]|uniref:sensor histidine kinase n=1 Tax=Amycolatopsis nigrescens TaxID=381445 RepID=UPI0003771593|nr:HAMP domain-containing histidine kinase [Amycolatopsis nigrescens]
MRLTARARLTILYTALVLAAGILLTALTYVLLRRTPVRRSVFVELRPPAGTPVPVPAPTRELTDVAERARDATLAEFFTQAAIALAVVTLLAAVLGWLVAGRVLRPIRAVSATAKRLSAENLSERVPVPSPADELAALAETINGMLDRIERGVAERDRALEGQRMFTANAAHELRTPLTTMRTAIDVTLDGEPSTAELLAMTGDIKTAVEHSQRTLDGLLTLARSQVTLREPHPVDLGDVLRGALDRAGPEIAAQRITLAADLRPAPVGGESALLERMAGNLIGNAIRHNHVGGMLAVSTGTSGSQAHLRVTNTGRPIPAGEPDRLLEPFVRGDGDRIRTDNGTGLGLGLSIVRAVVAAHHGRLSIAARPAGGLDITVHFTARVQPERS